jgi:thioredoxin 1
MQTTLIILGIFILVFGLLMYRSYSRMKNMPMVENHENIINLTDKNFNNQTKGRLMLVDFWAAWCGPCRMIAPILNDLAGELEGSAYIGKVDVDKYQSLAQKFQVRGIPTLILFRDGKELKRFVGVKPKNYLLKEIKSAIA